jgi:peptidoglycan/LPS O-acetylase OafA/YrhL
MKPKLLFLESLRGIAALSVALFHVKDISTSPITNNLFIENSDTMVDFFFVLSGFVIAYTYLDRITDIRSLVNFKIKRFLRLYPLHFVTLFVFLFIEIAKYILESFLGISSNVTPFSTNNLTSFVSNLFLFHSFTEPTVTFNAPSWSISTEFYTYLIFGLVLLISSNFSNKIRPVLLFVVMAVSAYLVLIFDAMEEFVGVAMFRCMYSFFLGTLIFYIFKKIKTKTPMLVSLGLIFFSIWAVCYPEIVPKIYLPILFSLVIFSLITSNPNNLINILNSRYLVFLGTVSYGIYMVHYGVWWIYQQSLRFIFNFETEVSVNGGLIIKINPFESTLMVVSGIVLVIFLSWLSYKYIEVPFNNLRHKVKI